MPWPRGLPCSRSSATTWWPCANADHRSRFDFDQAVEAKRRSLFLDSGCGEILSASASVCRIQWKASWLQPVLHGFPPLGRRTRPGTRSHGVSEPSSWTCSCSYQSQTFMPCKTLLCTRQCWDLGPGLLGPEGGGEQPDGGHPDLRGDHQEVRGGEGEAHVPTESQAPPPQLITHGRNHTHSTRKMCSSRFHIVFCVTP